MLCKRHKEATVGGSVDRPLPRADKAGPHRKVQLLHVAEVADCHLRKNELSRDSSRCCANHNSVAREGMPPLWRRTLFRRVPKRSSSSSKSVHCLRDLTGLFKRECLLFRSLWERWVLISEGQTHASKKETPLVVGHTKGGTSAHKFVKAKGA